MKHLFGKLQIHQPILIAAGIVGAAALAGYVVTCAMYPSPILPKRIEVPSLRTMDPGAALSKLSQLGLRGRITDTVLDPQVPAGRVAWQSPPQATVLPEGSMVRFAVSGGTAAVSVPDVIDMNLSLAMQVVEAAGLRTGAVDTAHNPTAAGTVLNTKPAAGTLSRPGAPVELSVSGGPEQIRVPDVVGLPLVLARGRLATSGFRVGTLTRRPVGRPGNVLAQHPAAGDLAARDSAVDLTISETLQ